MEGIKKSNLPLTGFNLKIIGIILMLFDHIHQMFYFAGVPMWFTIIGRLVAPIFIFLLSESMTFTHNRLKYIRNLMLGSIFMVSMSGILQKIMPNDNVVLMNNIFGTLFTTAFIITVIDGIVKGIKERKFIKILLCLTVLALYIAYNILFGKVMSIPVVGLYIVLAIPPIFLVEGGPLFILLGLMFYYSKRKKILQILSLIIISAISTGFWMPGFELSALFTSNFQWFMVLSGILIALYNGKEGKKMKRFFYVFYPAHIAIFYIISTMLF